MTDTHIIMLVTVIVALIMGQIFRYVSDKRRIIAALKTESPLLGLDLVHAHGVSRSNVYVILAKLEDAGLVEHYGGEVPPYLYKWVG